MIRRKSLADSMSQYLIARIEAHDRIGVATSTVISAADGRDHLESVELTNIQSGKSERFGTSGLFCFIGAEPASGWLPDAVTRDDRGFVLTDATVPDGGGAVRPRLAYETAVDGLPAAGDIRVGSMNRVAAAVGEGSSAIRSVHQYLAQFPDGDPGDIPAEPRNGL